MGVLFFFFPSKDDGTVNDLLPKLLRVLGRGLPKMPSCRQLCMQHIMLLTTHHQNHKIYSNGLLNLKVKNNTLMTYSDNTSLQNGS